MPHVSKLPLFDGDDTSAPFRGTTPESRAASRSGAVLALTSRKGRIARYRELLTTNGPLTDHDAAALLRMPLASINATRGSILKAAKDKGLAVPIVAAGNVKVGFGFQRFSYRTLWKLAG